MGLVRMVILMIFILLTLSIKCSIICLSHPWFISAVLCSSCRNILLPWLEVFLSIFCLYDWCKYDCALDLTFSLNSFFFYCLSPFPPTFSVSTPKLPFLVFIVKVGNIYSFPSSFGHRMILNDGTMNTLVIYFSLTTK